MSLITSKCGQQKHTTHKFYTFVSYFLLHVLVIRIDFHQSEYWYRRKSVDTFPPERTEFVCYVCGPYFLVIDQHNGIILPKFDELKFQEVYAVRIGFKESCRVKLESCMLPLISVVGVPYFL
jgi:hypothetical protein